MLIFFYFYVQQLTENLFLCDLTLLLTLIFAISMFVLLTVGLVRISCLYDLAAYNSLCMWINCEI
jgi:hypothetical protein